MCQSLPVGMLARLSALGTELCGWAQQHRDAPLAATEQAVLSAVRAALPDLLGAVVQASMTALDPGVAGVRRRCPRCDGRSTVQEWRVRRVQTVCGRITLRRPWYRCRPCGHGFSPVDAALALPSRARLSAGLTAWVVRLGSATTYREAAALLGTLTGLAVAPDTIRDQATICGTTLAAAQQCATDRVLATRDAAEPVAAAPGTMVVETDGVLVRYQDGWHEVKVGLVGGCVDGTLTALSYVAAREPAERFGPRLLAEAARRGALDITGWAGPLHGRGLAVLRPVHVVGDGAPWIWVLADDHFGDRTEVVDFYHAAEHLWTVARALFGAETAETAVWAHAQIERLYNEGGGAARRALAAATPPTAVAAEILRLERGYFATNAARMAYPAIRDRLLPIGSGAVESSAKHVIQHRMKRPGQRWSERGAHAMIALRACFASSRSPHPSCNHPH